MQSSAEAFYYKPAAFAAAVAVSLSALFTGIPVSAADPDDGDGGSSYDDGGGYDDGGSYDDGGNYDDPGVEDPSDVDDGGMDDAPDTDDPADENEPESPDANGEEPDNAPEPAGEEPGGQSEEPDSGTHEPSEAPEAPSGTEAPDEHPSATEAPDEHPSATESPDEDPSGTETPDDKPDAEPKPDISEVPPADDTAARRGRVVGPKTTRRGARSYGQKVKSAVSAKTTRGRLNSPVKKWNSRWTAYDRYYRPVFANPYQTPLQVVYDDGGSPRTFTVPPLQRGVIDTPGPGVYSFTASTQGASGPPTNVSVGSFSGGGFKPAPGQAPPQKPAALNVTKNALVQITFDQGTSAPFRVRSLTDLGNDPAVGNTTRVLLDGEIPAWGKWSKDDHGEALFQISRTQLLPGIDPPAQDPLPGYDIKLVAAQHATASASWASRHRTILIGGGVAAGVVVLAGVAGGLMIRRRRAGGG